MDGTGTVGDETLVKGVTHTQKKRRSAGLSTAMLFGGNNFPSIIYPQKGRLACLDSQTSLLKHL